jgi:hypothetical protein
MRKSYHGSYRYVILSKSIFYQFLEGVQASKISSRKSRSYLPKILPGSLSSRFSDLSNPYQGVGPNFLEENLSHGYSCQNLILCGLYHKLDLHSKFSLASSLNFIESLFFKKGLELSKWCFIEKNRTVRF